MKYFNPRNRLAQRGLSLVELMVSLTIGILTSSTALLALQLTQTTSTHVSGLTQMQQQAAYAIHVIGLQVKQAGSLALQPPSLQEGWGVIITPLGFPSTTTAVSGATQGDGTDILTLRYVATPMNINAGGSLQSTILQTDCFGGVANRLNPDAPPAEQITVNEFSLIRQNLVCRSNVSNATQTVLSNVTDFKARYLVQARSNVDVTRPVLQYLNADEITKANAWTSVVGVEVCFELLGPVNSVPEGLSQSTYVNCQDQSVKLGNRLKLVAKNFYRVRSAGNG